MTVATTRIWTCDGCGAATNAMPAWIHGAERNSYQSNVGIISTGPDYDFDYCRECWKKMKAALRAPAGQSTSPEK